MLLVGGAPALHATADTLLITGANSGLGIQLVKQYAMRSTARSAPRQFADTGRFIQHGGTTAPW